MKKNRRNVSWYYVAGGVLFLVIAFISIRIFVFHKIKEKIITEINALRSSGATVTYDSLYAHPWRNVIGVTNVSIVFPLRKKNCPDSTGNRIAVASIKISGFSIFSIVFNKRVHVDDVILVSPVVRYSGEHAMKRSQNPGKGKINGVRVGHFKVTGANINLLDSATCTPQYQVDFDLLLNGLTLNDLTKSSPSWQLQDLIVSSFRMKLPKSFYTFTMLNASYHSTDKSLSLDSVKVIPEFDRLTFAEKTGIQTDRITASIPSIVADGVEIGHTLNPSFYTRSVKLNFLVDVFRDKRFPVAYKKTRMLPVRFLRAISIPLQIDTVVLEKSHIKYEEFPDDGPTAGHVSFENLTAVIRNVSNNSTEPSTMDTYAKFMNEGALNVHFTFPSAPDKAYTVHGALTGFNLPAINPMLMPVAHAQIKSGNLKELKFQFEYNDYRSDGTLTMDYNDLNMVSLAKNSN